MIDFHCTNDAYLNDLMELVRAFEQRSDEAISLAVDYEVKVVQGENHMKITLTSDRFQNFVKVYRYRFESCDAMQTKRLEKRYLKTAIYNTLSFLLGVNLPYGCLTGIRPTKLYAELGEDAERMFSQDFSVQPAKLELIKNTVRTQSGLRNPDPERVVDAFVFIPFCPTKCAYCSFVSLPIDRQRKLLEPYVTNLVRELGFLNEVVKKKNYKVRAVYVGGGTPTSLPEALLDRVLAACRFKGAEEFTVEAGRPDTITPSVLDVLQSRGVNRISVNPQTFNDATLQRIGRRHTAQEVIDAYALARDRFKVNMDLIAMLPGEDIADFMRTVDRAVDLSPANITVHTLYLKRGSALRGEGYHNADNTLAERMVDYACNKLTASGYAPYYMYRQKYTSGNLENVGYSKRGDVCLYNVDIMEEDTTILAAGAAAISKKVTPSINLIERNANYKEPLEYIKHFDTIMHRQRSFWL